MKTPIKGPAILLFKGRGIVSTLIRWQSRGKYSHAALLMPDGRIVESWQGDGVRVKTLTDWEDIDAFTIPDMPGAAWDDAIQFALDQVGKGYDYKGVARFVSRRRHYDDIEKWFCSELVFAALESVGFAPFHRIEPWAISPGMLCVSPMLAEIKGAFPVQIS